ncbi:MAG: IS3-like element ISGur5 family transposase, partial [Candidatus Anammoxibacter sp.]
ETFVDWYNTKHKQCGIKYVTPEQRHCGQDATILNKRVDVYRKARSNNPSRWSKNCRDWSFIEKVYLNPEKEAA